MQTNTRRKRGRPPGPAVPQTIWRELAQAVGADAFQYRDPVAHLTERFQITFDRQGLRRAANPEGQGEDGVPNPDAGKTLPNTEIALCRFSQLAFQRGTLAASILAGTGKMMLVSCLKGALGRSGSKPCQTRTLFQTGSQRRNVPGRDPDQMLFNRGVAGSAVGIVVDALRGARRVVQSMQEMAEGTGELAASEGGVTLQTMYPFLNDRRERELLEKYSAQLKGCTSGEERPVLQNALVHTRAVLDKKAQMRTEFTNKLRFLAARAEETLMEFEAPGFVELVTRLLNQEEEPEPPDNPGEGGNDHGTDGADGPEGDRDAEADAGTEPEAGPPPP